jgi:hypothetical protein
MSRSAPAAAQVAAPAYSLRDLAASQGVSYHQARVTVHRMKLGRRIGPTFVFTQEDIQPFALGLAARNIRPLAAHA